jgi:hypothetical protein
MANSSDGTGHQAIENRSPLLRSKSSIERSQKHLFSARRGAALSIDSTTLKLRCKKTDRLLHLALTMALRRFTSLLLAASSLILGHAFPVTRSSRSFDIINQQFPKLVLITGSSGVGKSTFGMSVALDQGIRKCISTDSVQSVMRSFVDAKLSPGLHRSSYEASFDGDDPVRSWKETCVCLSKSLEQLVSEAMDQGQSLVVEGVHVLPSQDLIDMWEQRGGVAIGVLLKIENESKHLASCQQRGVFQNDKDSGKGGKAFERIRLIQEEMKKMAAASNWVQIEQRVELDPLDLISAQLSGIEMNSHMMGNNNGGSGGYDGQDAFGREEPYTGPGSKLSFGKETTISKNDPFSGPLRSGGMKSDSYSTSQQQDAFGRSMPSPYKQDSYGGAPSQQPSPYSNPYGSGGGGSYTSSYGGPGSQYNAQLYGGGYVGDDDYIDPKLIERIEKMERMEQESKDQTYY